MRELTFQMRIVPSSLPDASTPALLNARLNTASLSPVSSPSGRPAGWPRASVIFHRRIVLSSLLEARMLLCGENARL